MPDDWFPDEADVRKTVDFCGKYPQPYGAVLFALLMARQMELGILGTRRTDTGGGEPELPWVGLSAGLVAKIKAFARSVEAQPLALARLYEFTEDDVTVVVAPSSLGATAKAKMQSVALLYALARTSVYGDKEIAWSSVRQACSSAGVEDKSGNFATYMRDAEFPATYEPGAAGKLKAGGSLVSKGRGVVKRILENPPA